MSTCVNCPKCAAPSAGRDACRACGLIFAKYRERAAAPARSAEGPRRPRRYLPTLAANLLPLAGVLIMGWSAAPALFFLWLDTLLCSLRIIGPALAAAWSATHFEVEGRKEPLTLTFKVVAAPFLLLVFGAPAVMLGDAVYDLMLRQHPSGPLAVVFETPAIWLFIALQVAARGIPILVRMEGAASAPPSAAFGARLAEEFVNLSHRSALIMLLAWMAAPLGYWGLAAFLALAAAFISYAELHENWIQHFEAKARQWGEGYRARKAGKSS